MPCWFFEKHELERTPSLDSGLTLEQERKFRMDSVTFILKLGNGMGLRYDTCATACVYFHRFYMFHSFKDFPRLLTAAACLFLAGKVEETPKKCKDVCHAASQVLSNDAYAVFESNAPEKVMTYERVLLQTIKFDLIVEHPYQYILKYAKQFKGDKSKIQKLVQMAWTFVNDSLRTMLCLEWEPAIIAIAFLCLAEKFTDTTLNDIQGRRSGSWWDVFIDDLSFEVIEDICHQMLDLYSSEEESQSSRKKKEKTVKKPPTSPKSTKSSPHTPLFDESSQDSVEAKKLKYSKPTSQYSSPLIASSEKKVAAPPPPPRPSTTIKSSTTDSPVGQAAVILQPAAIATPIYSYPSTTQTFTPTPVIFASTQFRQSQQPTVLYQPPFYNSNVSSNQASYPLGNQQPSQMPYNANSTQQNFSQSSSAASSCNTSQQPFYNYHQQQRIMRPRGPRESSHRVVHEPIIGHQPQQQQQQQQQYTPPSRSYYRQPHWG